MNTKKRELSVLILAAALLCCSCGKNNEKSEIGDNGTYGFEQVIDNETVTGKTPQNTDSDAKENIRLPRSYSINKANICEMNDIINAGGMEFSINNVDVCQELPDGITKDEVLYFNEKSDENGKLEDIYRYIFIHIHIKNITESEITYYVSNGEVIEMDDNGNITDSNSEVRYQSLFDESTQSIKDYYKLVLKPHETADVNLGHIVNTSLAESGKIYYSINVDSNQLSKEIKAFKIIV